jgi:hypothetical protein
MAGGSAKFAVGLPPPPDVIDALSGLKGIEFVDESGGICGAVLLLAVRTQRKPV